MGVVNMTPTTFDFTPDHDGADLAARAVVDTLCSCCLIRPYCEDRELGICETARQLKEIVNPGK